MCVCVFLYSLDGHVLLFVVLDDIDVTLLFFFLCIADFLDYQYIYIYIYIYITHASSILCVFYMYSLIEADVDGLCLYVFFFFLCLL